MTSLEDSGDISDSRSAGVKSPCCRIVSRQEPLGPGAMEDVLVVRSEAGVSSHMWLWNAGPEGEWTVMGAGEGHSAFSMFGVFVLLYASV